MQQVNDKASYSPAFFPQHVSCCFIFPLCPFKSKLILISSLLNPITSSSLHPSWFVFLSQDYSAGSLPNLGYSCYLLLFIFSPVLSLVLLPLPAAAAATAKSLQSCLTLCNPMDCSLPGFSTHGILQARTREWVAISFSSAWKWKVKVKSLSRVWLLATPWTAAYQAPPSMGFSGQQYWSGVPLPSPFLCLLLKYQYFPGTVLVLSYLRPFVDDLIHTFICRHSLDLYPIPWPHFQLPTVTYLFSGSWV